MFFNSSSTGSNHFCHVIRNINTCAEIDIGMFATTFGIAAAILFIGMVICYCRDRRVVNDIEMNQASENTSQIAYNRV